MKIPGIQPITNNFDLMNDPQLLHKWLTGGSDNVLLVNIESDFGEDYGINQGDWVIIDRAREPQKNDVVVNFAPGGFVVINYHLGLQFVEKLSPESRLQRQSIMGVIIFVIRKMVKD